MKLIDAQQQLLKLQLPVITTADAATCLHVERQTASQILLRLTKANIITQVKRDLWAFTFQIEPLQLPEYITAPFPAYVSLQTALYYHEMISQIPQNIYVVSTTRTKKILSSLGTFSIHHIDPDLFFGFDIIGHNNIKMASPEKALLDILYLSPTKSLLFKTLPEIEIPSKLNLLHLKKMINEISSSRIKTIILNNLEKLLAFSKIVQR